MRLPTPLKLVAGLSLLAALWALPVVVEAQSTNGLVYTSLNGTITITRYSGPDSAVILPDTILGLPVTSIGDSAFKGRTNLTSVTLPSSLTSIGFDALLIDGFLGAPGKQCGLFLQMGVSETRSIFV